MGGGLCGGGRDREGGEGFFVCIERAHESESEDEIPNKREGERVCGRGGGRERDYDGVNGSE